MGKGNTRSKTVSKSDASIAFKYAACNLICHKSDSQIRECISEGGCLGLKVFNKKIGL